METQTKRKINKVTFIVFGIIFALIIIIVAATSGSEDDDKPANGWVYMQYPCTEL